MTRAIIHSDGACTGNPGPGGFGAIIELDGKPSITVTGGDPQTTNNRMELTAIIEAFRVLNNTPDLKGCPVLVRTDSQYIVNAFNQDWLGNWQLNGWRTAKRKPVLNQDLWETLIEETALHTTTWEWVKGHNGDPMNEECDKLAVAEAAFAPQTNAYWVSVGTPRSKAQDWYVPDVHPQTPPDPGIEALRLMEAMQVALEECHTFEQFRDRMLRVARSANW